MKFNKSIRLLFLNIFFIFSIIPAETFNINNNNTPCHTFAYQTFDDWQAVIKNLPFFRYWKPYSKLPKNLTRYELEQTVKEYKTIIQNQLTQNNLWVDSQTLPSKFFEQPSLFPFAQKLELPEGSEVTFHGDLHGDIHALMCFLNTLKEQNYLNNTFKIIKDNFYLVFLGDYVDRGNFGIEVIYTLLRLKIANPEKVILVRGNHEDLSINRHPQMTFAKEVKERFKQQTEKLLNTIGQIYEYMPVVLYVGSSTDFLQCNHGGMEIGYLPHNLLAHKKSTAFEAISTLNRADNFNNEIKKFIKIPSSMLPSSLMTYAQKNIEITSPIKIGFLWNDFLVNPESYFEKIEGRGYGFGQSFTHSILQASGNTEKKVVGVFRAHQHSYSLSDMMQLILQGSTPGVGKLWHADEHKKSLWEGIVATFNVTPDTPYGAALKFNYDTNGRLTIGKKFPEDWQLKVENIIILK